MKTKIILASQSEHRKALLNQVALPFEAHPAPVNERELEKSFNEPLDKLAEYLSFKKAEAVFKEHNQDLVIGSDQVLLFENQTLNKPETNEEVFERLKKLSGKTHQLSTGLCILYKDTDFRVTVTADLEMHLLSDEEILRYIDMDQPAGCAGGYKIEKNGPLLFKSIQTSDYHSIIGLPLLELLTHLRSLSIFKL